MGDDLSRLYELRLSFSHSDWAAGHVVRIAVPVVEPRNAVVVPRDALVIRRGGTFVFRVELPSSVATRIPVELGIGNSESIEVTGALQPGDVIIVQGNERLMPGQTVQILSGAEPDHH